MDSNQDNGGPAFPFGVQVVKHDTYGGDKYTVEDNEPGMTLRDYFAAHGVQPGCGEIATMAGLTYANGGVWSDPNTRLGHFDEWFCSLPLTERLDLFARVKYAIADAMLKARSA